ncbi:MAG: ribosomal-processing cysteine protease Prp [Lachnospiraceae bacterium]|nr:ribosomal-processing cysteine protease Prp [Lachnospiraceae bacterium]MDY6221307.1 ribosomal-processing cysteine protease Prp [Candidatus Alectryocaccobium sp.]
MTEVTFFQKETGELTGFRIENHAGFDDEGKDIVCAAISALAINTINSINELTSDTMDVDMDEDEAYIDASIFDTPCKEAQLLLKSLALGLENLEDDEAVNNFIDVIFEEV